MQRALAFVFESARQARAFGAWLTEHFAEIKQAAPGRLEEAEHDPQRILDADAVAKDDRPASQ